MNIKFIRGLWGMEEHSLKKNLEKIKLGGFDGVEMGAPKDPSERKELKAMLKDLQLEIVGQQWSGNFAKASVEDHISSFKEQFKNNVEAGCVFINSHTGKDYFSLADNIKIFKAAENFARELGIKLVHEIHRGRATFSTLSTMTLCEALPTVRLTADFSHWCCVHESFLEDQADALQKAIGQTDYIHARVGHSQGPQITDPRAPEWSHAIEHHLNWWDKIINLKKMQQASEFYICPEFGPYPYMTHLPLGNVPISNLWDINMYMKDLLLDRYAFTN
jgi:sugar phosphate isomerase/epimerase